MTDLDVVRWTVLVFLTWRGCGIGWKLAAVQVERFRAWYWERPGFAREWMHKHHPERWDVW